MLVGDAAQVPLPFQGVEAIERRLIGSDLAAELNFPDEGRLAVFVEVALDELKDRLLFLSEG